MVNGIRTINPRGLGKEFISKFCVGFRVRHKTVEEGEGCIGQNLVNITITIKMKTIIRIHKLIKTFLVCLYGQGLTACIISRE